MKVLFENEYVRFWLDGHSPILYSKVIAIPQKIEELKRMCSIYGEAIRSALRSYKKIYALSDFSEIKRVPPNDMIQFYANFLPGLKSNGIAFKAFIKPAGEAEQVILNDIINNSAVLRAASYMHFEEALSAINQLRQTESIPEKSLLSRILVW